MAILTRSETFGRGLCVALIWVALAPDLQAQSASEEELAIRASGEAYLRAAGRGIDSDVVYFDPTREAPPLDTSETPERQSVERPEVEVGRWPGLLISLAIVSVLVYFFARYGGAMSVSMRSEAGSATRARRKGSTPMALDDAPLQPIDKILRLTDRRAALIALARTTLAKVVEANGLLLQPSWTAREALRSVPSAQPHGDALRALVLASERVQFGNRDISEEDFTAHVSAIQPLLKGTP